MSKNQKGFSVIEGLLLLVVVGIIGGVGYFVYNSQKDTNQTLDNATNVSTSSTPKTNTAAKTNSSSNQTSGSVENSGYLVINEWGIKVKLGSADPTKVTYVLSGATNDVAGDIKAVASIELASSVTTDAHCKTIGIGIYQRTFDTGSSKKVGAYWYGGGGNPFACGDAALDAIRQQYTGNNPSTWEYSSID